MWFETTQQETEQRREEGGDDSQSEINGDGQKKVTTEGERVRKCVKCRKADDSEDELERGRSGLRVTLQYCPSSY